MTQPSDRARNAAAENAAFARMLVDARWEGLAEGLAEWCLAKAAWDAGKSFATFERETPGFAARRVKPRVVDANLRALERRALTPAPPASDD